MTLVTTTRLLAACFAFQAGKGLIVTEDVINRVGMGGRFDPREIQFAELFDILEDASQLGLKSGGFFVGEFNSRQAGDIADIKIRAAHESPHV